MRKRKSEANRKTTCLAHTHISYNIIITSCRTRYCYYYMRIRYMRDNTMGWPRAYHACCCVRAGSSRPAVKSSPSDPVQRSRYVIIRVRAAAGVTFNFSINRRRRRRKCGRLRIPVIFAGCQPRGGRTRPGSIYIRLAAIRAAPALFVVVIFNALAETEGMYRSEAIKYLSRRRRRSKLPENSGGRFEKLSRVCVLHHRTVDGVWWRYTHRTVVCYVSVRA